ncbi:MAG: discoidin domain-containing protein [Planctomycetota bacterium]
MMPTSLLRPLCAATLAAWVGLPHALGQSGFVLEIGAPQTAGICGYRKMWDQPVMTGADGLRVIIEPLDKDYAIKDRGGVAPWATPTLEAAGKPAALAFDAIHRTLLVRFPDAAEKIAAALNKGQRIEKLELVLPFGDEELWPEGGGFNPPAPPPGYGYDYRANWGVEQGYRVVRPRWHAIAKALKKPWVADPKLGPTYNAYINGVGYWAHFGAQDDSADRLPTEFGPAEVSYQKPEGRLDLTPLVSDEAYGKTLAERLRTLADCGVAIKKWEIYDHLYYAGNPYEWGTGVGGRAIIIQPPKLVVTFAADTKAPRVDALPPAADIAALANSLRKSGGGKPTAVMPTPDQIKAFAERFQPKRQPWMTDWQWAHIQDLLKPKAGGNPDLARPDDPFWVPFLNPMLSKGLREKDADGQQTGPIDLVRSYEMWVDHFLQRPYRGFHGHGTISDLIQPWFEYREALPAPVHEWYRNHLTAFLVPDRPTAATHEKRRDRSATDGAMIHPMSDTAALGAPKEAQPVIADKKFDSYVATTGDWRGNKSFYRSGFCYEMSTQNFNNNASLAALVGGGIIGSQNAIADGRNGQIELASRLWTWFDGSSQEELDDYYYPFTVKAAKLVADYGPDPFDRLLGRSQLAKHMTTLADTYHSGLRRYVNGASRSSLICRLGTQEGLYAMLHTASKTGAVTDLGSDRAGGVLGDKKKEMINGVEQWVDVDLPKWGNDTPPGEVGRQALASPYAPQWYQRVIDDKPLPFETTALYKKWGGWAKTPAMRRTYLGHHFGLFSLDAQTGWLPITGHWRRQDAPAAGSRDVGTWLARFGSVNHKSQDPGARQTWFPQQGPGWMRVYGMQATLQAGPRMIIATSPGKLDAGYQTTGIQSSLGFYNYESPTPSWEIYVDGKRQVDLPIKAKAGQRIAIKDGVTYIGIIPLPSTDLGRSDEVVLHPGARQEFLGQFSATAALVIDNVLLQRDEELPQAGTDWAAIDKGYGGFVLEFGDTKSHKDFATFQKMLQDAKLTATFDAGKALHEVRYEVGTEVLELGANTLYDPGKGSADNLAPFDQLFAYRRVNGQDAALPAGVERDSPFSQQAMVGRIEKGGAVLTTTPGQQAMLQWEPNTRVVSAWNPLPDLNDFALDLPGGGRITANGRIGLACVTVDPAAKTVTIDHAFNGDQAAKPEAATAVFVAGLDQAMRFVLNGEPVAALPSTTVDGAPAILVPLVPDVTPEAAVKHLERSRAAAGKLPAEWAARNVAPRAMITASSEADPQHAARFVADGRIASAQSKHDNEMAWAAALVKPPYAFPEGISLAFAWQEPVQVAEVVYYGRTAWLWTENFKSYELYLDDAKVPAMKGELRQGHGPQRIQLPKAETARRLTLKFLDSHGDYSPGAAEVQIFTESPPDDVLPAFMAAQGK